MKSAIDDGKGNFVEGETANFPAGSETPSVKASTKKVRETGSNSEASNKSMTSKDAKPKRAGSEAPSVKASTKKVRATGSVTKTAVADEDTALLGQDPPQLVDATNTYSHDEEFLNSQREALLAEKATYLEQANSLREEADSLISESEPGDIQFDEESGEGSTSTIDRERDLTLSAQALAAVEEIDHALHKLEIGKYGVCESCGQLIVKDRLEALPYARLCIACKSGGLSRR